MAIELISKIKPKNNGSFALVDAKDIEVDESGKRLDTKLAELEAGGGGGSGSGQDLNIENGEGKYALVQKSETANVGAGANSATFGNGCENYAKNTFVSGRANRAGVEGQDTSSNVGRDSLIGGNSNIEEGGYSIVGGANNKNHGLRTLLTGNNNENKGTNNIMGGESNKTAENASRNIIGGTNNKCSKKIPDIYGGDEVLTSDNIVAGQLNSVYQQGNIVGGKTNEMYANMAFHSGKSHITYKKHNHSGLIGYSLRSTRENQTFVGQLNSEEDDTVLFGVGNGDNRETNGTSGETRSNAFTSHKDGHAEVQTQGETDKSVVIRKTLNESLVAKQSVLISGENIKTINGKSILGSGNLSFAGDGSAITVITNWDYLTASINTPPQATQIDESMYFVFGESFRLDCSFGGQELRAYCGNDFNFGITSSDFDLFVVCKFRNITNDQEITLKTPKLEFINGANYEDNEVQISIFGLEDGSGFYILFSCTNFLNYPYAASMDFGEDNTASDFEFVEIVGYEVQIKAPFNLLVANI